MNKITQKDYHKKWWLKLKKDPIRLKERKIKQKFYRELGGKRYQEMTTKWRATPSGIFTSLKNRGRNDFDLNKNDFISWYEKQEKKCSYCNLTLEEIRKLPYPYNRKNGLIKFSIDRKDNSKGYTIDNIALSCFTCNTIKNNFFTFEEMLKIGKEIIEPKLRLLI